MLSPSLHLPLLLSAMALDSMEGKTERVQTLITVSCAVQCSIKAMCCTHSAKANLAQAVVDWDVFPTSLSIVSAATDPITDPALTCRPHLDNSYVLKRVKAVIRTPFVRIIIGMNLLVLSWQSISSPLSISNISSMGKRGPVADRRSSNCI